MYFSQFWRLESPKSSYRKIQCLVRDLSSQIVLLSCIFTWKKVAEKLPQSSFISTYPIQEGTTLMIYWPPPPSLSLNIIALVIRVSAHKFGWNKYFQAIAILNFRDSPKQSLVKLLSSHSSHSSFLIYHLQFFLQFPWILW